MPARANNVDKAGVKAEGQRLDRWALPRQREVLHLVRLEAKVRLFLSQKLPQHNPKREYVRLLIGHPAPAHTPSTTLNVNAAMHET
jgi:hypothetical protein